MSLRTVFPVVTVLVAGVALAGCSSAKDTTPTTTTTSTAAAVESSTRASEQASTTPTASASATEAATSATTPATVAQAQDSSRYGHFGDGPQQGKESAPEKLSDEQVSQGKQIAAKVVGLWIGPDHDKPVQWRNQLYEYAGPAFHDQVRYIVASHIETGQVTGVKKATQKDASLTVVVTTSLGDYTVNLTKNQDNGVMQVNYLAADWRKSK